MGIKILMIGPYPLEPGVVQGGIESATSVLVPALAQRDDVESVTVLRFHNGEAATDIRREGAKVTVHYLRGQRRLRTITGSFLDVRRTRRLAAQVRPDVVHGQEIGLYGDIALRCSQNTAVTVHGLAFSVTGADTLDGVRLRERLRDRMVHRMCRRVVSRAKVVISISDWDARALDVPLRGTRVCIPNPVGAEFFDLAPSGPTAPRVLFAGGFTPNKNPLGVVNAFARVVAAVPAARLSLVGPAPDPKYLQRVRDRITELGIGHAVEMTGTVGNEQMRNEISAARTVILFSRQENSPTILAQAMAAGKPVVASRVGGVPEMVDDGESGFLTEPDDEATFADRMLKLIHDQDLSLRLGRRANAVARERFTADTVADLTVAAYRNAMARGGPRW
ncbi:glycosyltransferase family 4 protein [Mycobacterium sp. SMC-4]|uniref:glycosyltransferase family 4 protein n=1 Tax=Mycobacterium sp. SMC-4 TaxID=2857059 RepID=UPI003CFFAFA9